VCAPELRGGGDNELALRLWRDDLRGAHPVSGNADVSAPLARWRVVAAARR